MGSRPCGCDSRSFEEVVWRFGGGKGGWRLSPCFQKDLAAWRRRTKQGHIPFRADCRICGEAMGCDKPRKRLGGSATKFTMSADLCGPFPEGKDWGTGVICKYALVSTVAVLIISELPGEVTEPCDTAKDVEHTEELPCEPEDRDLVPEDEVRRLNGIVGFSMPSLSQSRVHFGHNVHVVNHLCLQLGAADALVQPQGHQNVTLAEVIPDRAVESLVRALSRLRAKYRAQVYRLRTDRERSFASVPIQNWFEQRQIRLTMTAGDDSKANGRVEGEVNQLDSLDWFSSSEVGKSLSLGFEPRGVGGGEGGPRAQ